MANLAVGNILKFGIWTSDVEQAAVNTVYYHVFAVGGTPATDQDAVDAFSAAMAAAMKALLANGATYDGSQLRIQNVIPFPNVVISNSGNGAGSAGAVGLPRQTAGLCSWKTAFGGPGYRGRCYIPFPSASDNQAGGSPTAGYQTRLGDLVDAITLFSSISVGGRTASVEFGVYHQRGPGSPSFAEVTTAIASGKWATIKKRGSFGRANTSPFV